MKYTDQKRGLESKYATYYKSMDQVMAQKIASITSLFPTSGTILDMGSGSGRGSFDLASLFSEASVIGIDISAESVKYANDKFVKPNLKYQIGDISEKLFPENSIDAILNSSVIHHVTSFNNFNKELVTSLIKNQVFQLKSDGIICIRDFVAPENNEAVYLTIPRNDGDNSENPLTCNTYNLFLLFIKNFKCSLYPNGKIPYEVIETHPESITLEIELRIANEFILRKDYREDWEIELKEEYCYYTREEFEQSFKDAGVEILLSKPIYNQWIINNRWKNKIRISSKYGQRIFLPTNYLIIGKKNPLPEIAKINTRNLEKPEFLKFDQYIHEENGETYDLVSRPNPSIDIIPYYRQGENVYLLAREYYPRPIINSNKDARLDEARTSSYIIEPISCSVEEANVWAVKRELQERLGISKDQIKEITKGLEYYPSPGGTGEKVYSFLVEIKSPKKALQPLKNTSGFSYSGQYKFFDTQQLLRSSQMGVLSDARLELNAYFLLDLLEIENDPYIEEKFSSEKLVLNPEKSLEDLNTKKLYRERERKKLPNYLKVQGSNYTDGQNQVYLESVIPERRSENTVSVIPLSKNIDGELLVGLEVQSFAVTQLVDKTPLIYTNPAFRLPKGSEKHRLHFFLQDKFKKNYDTDIQEYIFLGGNYYPSCGTSPENVSVVACITTFSDKLIWIKFSELIKKIESLKDAHLIIALYRLNHLMRK